MRLSVLDQSPIPEGSTGPDGNDLELAWDRPVEQWPTSEDGHVQPIFGDLDLEDLLTER